MLIRTLYAHERPLFALHLKRLGDQDRRTRFASVGVSDERIDSYVAGIAESDLILAAMDGETVVGAAHVAFTADTAEVGVSVDADHRAEGLGHALLNQAASFARNRHAEKLYTLCLADNRSMVALARRTGMRVRYMEGEAEAFLDLPPPDVGTVGAEISTGLFSLIHDWAEMVESASETLMGALPSWTEAKDWTILRP
jgi:GNAT superfamily N-acetyltransferase